MKKPVVLVTGAGGFIGGWMAEAIHLSGWGQVRAGINRWSSAARIARFPVDIITCDIMNQESLDEALKGVDAVIHCARAKGNDNSVTEAGTRLLLERVKAAGVPNFVFMSSVAVYGEALGQVSEDTAPAEPMTIYGAGKRRAEAICQEYADETLAVSVIRPTLVYGPFSDQWTLPYIQRFASGTWRKLGAVGEGKCNLVYVGDLVRQALFMIEKDLGPYTVMNGNGPDVPTWNAYIERFNVLLGYPELADPDQNLGLKVAVRRPVRVLGKYALAHHKPLVLSVANRVPKLKALMRNMEADLRLRPNDDEMERFSADVTYTMDHARALGFVPRTSAEDGMRMTADWARSMGLAYEG